MELPVEGLQGFFNEVGPFLDERQRRLVAGALARSLGRGGPTRVAEAAGMSRNTVLSGMKEIASGAGPSDRVRAPGAGRRFLIDEQPGLLQDLDDLVEPESRGDPMSALRWTSKSTENLAGALRDKGYRISADSVGRLLKAMDYSLQAPAKQLEGSQHPDRDAQFRYLNGLVAERLGTGEPVVSIDCKKKEVVGEKANGGREYQPKGSPEKVDVHDFRDPEVPKAIPFGVYDLGFRRGLGVCR